MRRLGIIAASMSSIYKIAFVSVMLVELIRYTIKNGRRRE